MRRSMSSNGESGSTCIGFRSQSLYELWDSVLFNVSFCREIEEKLLVELR